jgi:predicted nucleic acid-binding protein
MEAAIVGVVLDSTILITAERKNLSVSQLVEAIQIAYGEIELSLSPVTVAELVHGIYRAASPEVSRRRSDYVNRLIELVPLHPIRVLRI